ncbi:tetratricopeptide repeat protein [Robbsia sp. Bb-Pol-6]|uniref:Tetratricopeptide repeat protein n=1 Tax=Robbsia betulipollinis TaxID=2981849 RepID=A0ABT3ZRZ4_9BURK|nr:tetratricopeptide repeat protein [Robbsia betulipollinis]MCY0388653.1 tetratricopeptide repeat protein [Robbsia betulipollinis]
MAAASSPPSPLSRALDAHRAGRLDEAERAYLSILANVPEAAAPSRPTAAPQPSATDGGEAVRPAEVQPAEARYWLGVLYLQRQRAGDACVCFRDVLARRPDHDAARLNLGHALQSLGDRDAAHQAFAHTARSAVPEIAAAAHAALGRHEAAAGRPADALRCFDASLAILPAEAAVHDSRGVTLAALGHHDLAEQAHRAALAIRPRHAGTHNNLGLAIKAQGDLAESLWHFRDALRIDPDFVPALVNLGQAVALGGDPDQASAPLERAVRLAPDFALAHHELACAYAALDRQEEAARHFVRTTELDPEFALGWQNLASARFETGERAAALAAVEEALRLAPASAMGRFARATLRLAEGGDRQAWQDYEARLAVWATQAQFAVPRWSGLPADVDAARGRAPLTLLVHAEQGFGDTLQFFRFVPLVAARVAHVVLAVPAPLSRLLVPAADAAGVTLLNEDAPLPPVDAHCPLTSLPLALGIGETPPAPPYLWLPGEPTLRADAPAAGGRAPVLRAWPGRLATRLRRRTARPTDPTGPVGPLRVGLAWSGRRPDLMRHAPDAPSAPAFDKRAVPLDALLPLFALRDIEWHVLQTEIDADDRAVLATVAERASLVFASDAFQDFADTAAAIVQLDQVLSVDTSVAHLAGALAAPLAIMLPLAADWRWDACDVAGNNLWYPAARLFRQRTRRDWSDVVQAVAEMLAGAVGKASSG